jgi:hypothetical protein
MITTLATHNLGHVIRSMAPRAGGFTLVAALQAGATTPHPIAARDSADRAYRVCPRG